MQDSCPMASTCDGSLVGSWEVKSTSCEGEAINRYQKGDCVSAIEPIGGVSESGTLTFSDNGKVTGSVTTQMRSNRTYDPACVETQFGKTLTEFCQDDGASDNLDAQQGTTQTCTFTEGSCVCDAQETRTVTFDATAYQISATTLIMGEFGFGSICVEADRATLYDASGPPYMVWKRVN